MDINDVIVSCRMNVPIFTRNPWGDYDHKFKHRSGPRPAQRVNIITYKKYIVAKKNGTAYFPQDVDVITDISVLGNFS